MKEEQQMTDAEKLEAKIEKCKETGTCPKGGWPGSRACGCCSFYDRFAPDTKYGNPLFKCEIERDNWIRCCEKYGDRPSWADESKKAK